MKRHYHDLPLLWRRIVESLAASTGGQLDTYCASAVALRDLRRDLHPRAITHSTEAPLACPGGGAHPSLRLDGAATCPWNERAEHRSVTYVSLTPLYPTCYKDSPFVLRPLCACKCTRMGASVPDAAKPHHFRLEVEACFRDSSRSTHVFFWRSAKTRAKTLCA